MTKFWETYVYARLPHDEKIVTYQGPVIAAETKELAILYCQNNGLGYCHVTGYVVTGEIPYNDPKDDAGNN